jgi:hypothetical protein
VSKGNNTMPHTFPLRFATGQEAASIADLAQQALDAAAPLACTLAERAARTRDAADARMATDAPCVAVGAWELAERENIGCLA